MDHHRWILLVLSMVVYCIGSPIVRDITGIHRSIRTGTWQWWLCDLPALVSGMLFGAFLAKY